MLRIKRLRVKHIFHSFWRQRNSTSGLYWLLLCLIRPYIAGLVATLAPSIQRSEQVNKYSAQCKFHITTARSERVFAVKYITTSWRQQFHAFAPFAKGRSQQIVPETGINELRTATVCQRFSVHGMSSYLPHTEKKLKSQRVFTSRNLNIFPAIYIDVIQSVCAIFR